MTDQYVEALVRVGVERAEAERRVADQRARGLLSEPPEPEPSFLRQLVGEAVLDPMVPKGHIEIHDGDGRLLRRQRIEP